MKFDKPIDQLLYLMQRLRDPETGCPWDVKQTYETIAPYTIEETYEVVDAITRKDYPHLQEELGDLLLQVIFYAQIAKEEGRFNFDAIVEGLNEKLLRRHPHVFPDGTPASCVDPGQAVAETEVSQNWQKIKQAEQAAKGKDPSEKRLLDAVAIGMPPLQRAHKLQKKAASVGFDWQELPPVIAKVKEEVEELEEAISEQSSREAIMGELGDVLFACVNLARHLKIDPELALKKTNDKFAARFASIEDKVSANHEDITALSLEKLDDYWNQVKREESID